MAFIYYVIYKPFYFLFPKLLEFICKIFFEVHFHFVYGSQSFLHGENFLITGTVEQDLESTEDGVTSQSNCNRFSLTVNALSIFAILLL